MSALTIGMFERPQYGMGRSFALSAVVHIALAMVLFLGVRWQVHAPDTVTVELVEAPPPPPPAAVEPPKPEPVPKVEPEPVKPVLKPDIALAEKPKPKPKPKPEVKPKPETKPKADPHFDRTLREQMAQEQAALESQRQERELRELLARRQAEAGRAAAAARQKALNEYIGRIQASIRHRIREGALEGISGNPAAEFEVAQLPTGEVISVQMRKSSGYPRYDEEVQRAIRAASPLPLPVQKELFSRELKLTFRPHDK